MNMTIRPMRPEDLTLALDWAAAEGWNPGLADAACFFAADPAGFLIGEIAGAQQENYRRSGFALLHRNIRYGSAAPIMPLVPAGPAPVPAASLPFALIAAYDRHFFPAGREAFLQAWLTAPGHIALALPDAGVLKGLAVLRPCREGAKIGPLFAESPAHARTLFRALLAQAPKGPVFLDLPEPNADARAMAESAGMTPAFETARMYAGQAPALPLEKIYGITSFELG